MKKGILIFLLVGMLAAMFTYPANAVSKAHKDFTQTSISSPRKFFSSDINYMQLALLLKLEENMKNEKNISKDMRQSLRKLKLAHNLLDPKLEALAFFANRSVLKDQQTQKLLNNISSSNEIIKCTKPSDELSRTLISNAKSIRFISTLQLVDYIHWKLENKGFCKSEVDLLVLSSYNDILITEPVFGIELKHFFEVAKDEKSISQSTKQLIDLIDRNQYCTKL
ncbi:MAG: hypothetical protein ACM3UU_09815 [Ignavibacteriales bacterium]